MSEEVTLKKKIKVLIIFRVVFITLFFGSSLLFWGIERFPYIRSLSYIIISSYVATIAYLLLIERIRNLFAFAYVQLVLDVIFEVLFIYITGGVDSWFSFSIILTIIASSIVLNMRAGYIIATQSSILYGMLINLQLYGILPATSEGYMQARDYMYKLFIHMIFFYITAYLSGYLSSRLERTVKKLEEKDMDILDLEFFNREVIEGIPSGLFTTDMTGKVLIFNRAAEQLTGVRKDDIIGKRIDDVLPVFSFPFIEGRNENTMLLDRVQKIIGIHISLLKSFTEENKGYIVIFQDLTQIKRLEKEMKQKEKWATIGEMSSNIAHEIRNPLASLRGSIEILKEDTVPRNYKEKLMDIALNEMDRLNLIITDFLTYSRPTAPVLQKCDLHSILDETIELLKNYAQSGGDLSIRKVYRGDMEVNADPQKMRQVFWNLGMNALEAMPEGGELFVSTDIKNGFAEITFKDSGTGIDTENLEKIFFPFFTTKNQGTGLGLAIAYRIIEEHGGNIQVSSEAGIGTTFVVILPKNNENS